MRNGKRSIPIILLLVLISGCLEGEDNHPAPLALIELEVFDLYSNETILFNGSSSIGHRSAIVEYEWNIKNSSLGFNDTITGKTIEYEFSSPGVYNVTLTVTDEKGYQDFEERNVTVEEKVIPFDLDDKWPGGENSFEWLYLNNSVITRITHLYWNISIIEGRGNDSRLGRWDFQNPELDLSGDYLILSRRFVEFLLEKSDTVIEKVRVGDHLSFFWPTEMFHFSPWTVLNITVWDQQGVKYAFRHDMEPISINNEFQMKIDREDIYVDSMDHNKTTIIHTSDFDDRIPSWAPPNSTLYWVPHNGTILFLNSTMIDHLGYFIVEVDRTQWDTNFYHIETWYYDSMLNFTSGSSELSLREGENMNITIDGSIYSINVLSVYKFTRFETYFLQDLPPNPGQSFFIERRD